MPFFLYEVISKGDTSMVIHSLLRSGAHMFEPFSDFNSCCGKKKEAFLTCRSVSYTWIEGPRSSLYSKSKHRHYHYELLFLMSLILFTAITADAHISILSGQINLSKLLINIPGRILDFITAFPGLGRRR